MEIFIFVIITTNLSRFCQKNSFKSQFGEETLRYPRDVSRIGRAAHDIPIFGELCRVISNLNLILFCSETDYII